MATRCCSTMRDRSKIRRQRIIDAARSLFVENGFHATGIAQIARQSGVAVGQIYRDFSAKEDIVAEIVTGDCATFMARETLARALDCGDKAAVWGWIRHFIAFEENDATDALFAEIVAEAARNERIAAIFAGTRETVIACLLSALALLAPGDIVAERRALLADLVLTQSLGVRQHRLMHPGFDSVRLTDEIMAIVMREIKGLERTNTIETAKNCHS